MEALMWHIHLLHIFFLGVNSTREIKRLVFLKYTAFYFLTCPCEIFVQLGKSAIEIHSMKKYLEANVHDVLTFLSNFKDLKNN